MKKIALLLSLALMVSAPLFADEIFLKGAGSFSGRITQESPEMVMIDTGDGTIGVPRDRIHHIEKGRSNLDEYRDRAKKLAPEDTKAWKELGRWAQHVGLSTQAREAYERVLKFSSNDVEAREALGYVVYNGNWVTEEESYRARGFVRYQGEWMTHDEVAMHESHQANEQAIRDAEQAAVDAEVAQAQAEQEADEQRKRAEEAEEEANRWSNSVYWGGWGYGSYWPANTTVTRYR